MIVSKSRDTVPMLQRRGVSAIAALCQVGVVDPVCLSNSFLPTKELPAVNVQAKAVGSCNILRCPKSECCTEERERDAVPTSERIPSTEDLQRQSSPIPEPPAAQH